MFELDAENAVGYLIRTGKLSEPVEVKALGYGVSNVVLWVDAPVRPFVIKQSREQLRTREPWFSQLERVYREADAMRALRPVIGAVVPEVLFEDRENFLFAMSAAPIDAPVWKQQLLDGVFNPAIARRCGEILSAVHQHGSQNTGWRDRFGDQANFFQLRLEPFYLRLRKQVPALTGQLDALVAETGEHHQTLVHADFSPKNMLVHGDDLTLVDYETVHFGDAAFDLGFFLAHLALKSIEHAPDYEPMLGLISTFWQAYLSAIDFEAESTLVPRSLRHLAGVARVRIDGTSPVDYLTDDARRTAGRALVDDLFGIPCVTWRESLDRMQQVMKSLSA